MRDVPVGSVCSGYGGLDLAISAAIPAARLAWVAEYEPPTAKVPNPVQGGARILAHRFPEVPNLGDITVVQWTTTQRAKIVAGGTPCQDVSAAGARKGMRAGTRSGIWSSMVEAITHHRPTLVVWENVLGALSADADSDVEPCPVCVGDERESHLRALGRVVGDLAEIGYDASWTVVSAASVGAPHRRERVIVLAWPANPDGERLAGTQPDSTQRFRSVDDTFRRDFDTANPDSIGQVRPRQAWGRGARPSDSGSNASDTLRAGLAADGTGDPEPELTPARSDRVTTLADAEGDGRDEGRSESAGIVGGPDASVGGSGSAAGADIAWGEFAGAIRRWESVLGRPAPAPTAPTARGGMALSPAFVEWMMGLPEGWVTDPAIWAGLSKSAARNAQLKALGNGVVPQQGAAAIGWLLQFAPVWVRKDVGLPSSP